MTAAQAPPTSRPTRSTATPQPSPTPTTRGGRSSRQVDGLSGIELTSASALEEYCRRLEDLGNALAFELEMSNRELETALANMPGMKLWGRPAARVKARIVSRHLKAAADTAAHLRTLATRTKMSYRKHFGDEPRSSGKVFDPHR